jgi:uncharacterized protein (UPF0335 family)
MRKLEQLEKDHLEYAEVINDFIAKPRTNGQLVDLIHQLVAYLQYSSQELHEYNEYVDSFIGALSKLP